MKKIEVYIHIPFCIKKCDYCDFLSAPSDAETRGRYVEAVKKEIILNRERLRGYIVDTVFIGGGTPSILEGEQIEAVMKTVRDNAVMSENAEITIECNPGTITIEKLSAYKRAGINRISFGLQSTNDAELQAIGRIHNYEDFVESYNMARDEGFNNINIDLMSALPGQTVDSYRETLKKVIELNPEHISSYSLIVEEGTLLKQRVEEARDEGCSILPDEDDEREMYYLTKRMLEEAGYKRYEISNYAKETRECRHNIGYWKRVDYLGFGIGAASLYEECRYNNISDINQYITNMEKGDVSAIKENQQSLSKEEQMEEFMFLGLRLMTGVSNKAFKDKFDVKVDDIYGDVVEKLVKQFLLEKDEHYLKLTEKGIDVSNYVMSEFVF